MSQRKKKNVPTVEAKKPEQSKPEAEDSNASGQPEDSVEAVAEQRNEAVHAQSPFDLSKINPEKVKMAEELGIPVGQILNWAASVEARFKVMEQEMPKKIVERLQEMAAKRQEQMIAQAQSNPQRSGSGGFGDMVSMIKEVAGSSGGSNPLQEKFMSEMMNKALYGMDLQNAFQKAIINRIAPEIANSIIPAAPTKPKAE